MSSLATRSMDPGPKVAPEVLQLLDHYMSVVKGYTLDLDKSLISQVQHLADNTWNNEDVSPMRAELNRQRLELEVGTILEAIKVTYSQCVEIRTDFQMRFEEISEPGRGMKCVSSWIATPETGGRHIRSSYPRDFTPIGLAHFVRLAIESAHLNGG